MWYPLRWAETLDNGAYKSDCLTITGRMTRSTNEPVNGEGPVDAQPVNRHPVGTAQTAMGGHDATILS
jgi:hypothetical protein